jgi:hypothetical protein
MLSLVIRTPDVEAFCARFSPDGTLLAIATSLGTVEVGRLLPCPPHKTAHSEAVAVVAAIVLRSPSVQTLQSGIMYCPLGVPQPAHETKGASETQRQLACAGVPHGGRGPRLHAGPRRGAREAALHSARLPPGLGGRADQERAPHRR